MTFSVLEHILDSDFNLKKNMSNNPIYFFAFLAILFASCESNVIDNTTILDDNFTAKKTMFQIPKENLNGWEIGYCLADKRYFVAYHDDTDNSFVAMINLSGEDAEKGLILVFNEEQEIVSVGTMEKLYDVSYEDDNIILSRINDNGFFEEEKIPTYQKKLAQELQPRVTSTRDIFKFVSAGAEFIDNIQSVHTIGSDVLAWDWEQIVYDIGEMGAGYLIDKIHPGLGFIYTVGKWPIDHYKKQNEERNRAALYGDCEISIDEIRPENGNSIVYATIKNADKLHDYLVNMYDRTENEKTRNLVSCGIVIREQNKHVTTHVYDYKSQETQLNGDIKYGSVANLAFTIIGLDLTQNLSTYYFRPYLTSTRMKSKRGEVAEGYIRYGEIVSYQAFNGEIKDFKQYDAQYSTDINNYGFVTFRTTIYASISNIDNLDEWGVYVYDLDGSSRYDYYPSEYRAAKLEDWIDIDFNINKRDFDQINNKDFWALKKVKIGIYQKIKNSTGNYDYMSYFYSEPQEYELTYSKKPTLSFTNTQFKGTEPYTEPNNYGWDTISNFSVKYDIEGAFFIDTLAEVLWGNWLNPGKTDLSNYYIYDGEHETSSFGIIYKSPGYSTCYRTIEMICGGNVIYSENYLQYINDGTSVSTLQIIEDSPSYSPKRFQHTNSPYMIPNGIKCGN